MTTVHENKINAARDCIREHLSHVAPAGSAAYATRDEALDAARDVIIRSEQLDHSQIDEAFRPFIS